MAFEWAYAPGFQAPSSNMPMPNFSPLGEIGSAVIQGRVANAFSGGVPTIKDAQGNDTGVPDYQAMSNKLYQAGDIGGGNTLAQIGLQRGQLAFARNAAGFVGGQASGAPSAAPATDQGTPRGIRNNNPLNIEAGSFASGQPGYTGSDGRFAQFQTPDQGMNAAVNLLRNYGAGGVNTINGIVGKWAPASDGNDTAAYAGYVSSKLGIPPNQPLNMTDPGVLRSLTRAMGEFENGRSVAQPQSVGASAVSASDPRLAGLVPAGVDPQQYLNGLRTIVTSGVLPAEAQKTLGGTIKSIEEALSPTSEQKQYYADRLPNETMAQYQARTAGQKKTAEEFAGIGAEQFKQAAADYKTAQNTLYRLSVIDTSINKLGPDWMGSSANARAGAAKAWGTLYNNLPDAIKSAVPQPNFDKIATWEDFNKQTTNLGFELARSLGSREAMMVVQQATNSVPNAEQSQLGAKLVSASLKQAAQRQIDYYSYLRAHPGQIGADLDFNNQPGRSPQDYADRAIDSVMGKGYSANARNNSPPAPGQPPAQPAAAPPATLLKPNVVTTFKNGQAWTLGANGQPQQVR